MSGLGWGIEAGFSGAVFGVDEVGRGPWAGPVVAAACRLDPARLPEGLADSKRLCAPRRNAIAAQIDCVALGEASVEEIDRLNIRAASLLAMARAVLRLAERIGPPAMVLIDGNALPAIPFPARALVSGDARVASIAAAAIVAKVHRDALMIDLCGGHPGYGWTTNKGYGTRAHADALDRLGPSPHHRRSFAPVARAFARSTNATA